MSPRRSSRARSSQQPPVPPHTNSSSSTSSSTTIKVEKNNRSSNSNRPTSPNRASVQRSESIDDIDPMARPDQVAPRRSRRGAETEKEIPAIQEPEEEEVDGMEEEVTRCICGNAEYPGPGASIREQHPPNIPLSEDIGNFFVQCDNCHVWQHGGCMGLTDESMLPDEYYCEKCKPEFHKIIKGPNSTRTSHYLPILEESTRSTPLSSIDPGRGKDGKIKSLQSTKRRATLNSRGAYDEDEALRRAIEESKADGTLGKRTREDSEDRRQIVKRQRTASSASTGSRQNSQSPDAGQDPTRSAQNKNAAKLRGAAARNNKEKELRDKQKQETAAQRAEAANKRNARSERRRGDESPPPTPSLSPSKAAQAMAAAQKNKPETPPLGKATLNRKAATRIAARGRRVGRNQYTRDMALNGDASDTPHRDTSHDRNGSGSSPQGVNGMNGESGRSSKARTHPARTSLNEMKKRVAAILEFVGQMQTQPSKMNSADGSSNNSSTKGNSTPNGTSSANATNGTLPTSTLVQAVAAGLEEIDKLNGSSDGSSDDGSAKIKIVDEQEFGKMGSQEMMETLTKELVQWQTAYGFYTR